MDFDSFIHWQPSSSANPIESASSVPAALGESGSTNPVASRAGSHNASVTVSLVLAYSACVVTEIDPSRNNSFQQRLCTAPPWRRSKPTSTTATAIFSSRTREGLLF